MPYWIGEIVMSALAALAGAAFWVGSIQFASPYAGVDLGPAFFPRLLSALLIILSGGLCIKIFSEKHTDKRIETRTFLKVICGMLLCLLYIYLIPVWGYFYSTLCFTPLLLWYQGYRKIPWVGAVTLGFTVMAYIVFYRFLGTPLPL